MTAPRIAAVEENPSTMFRLVSELPSFTRTGDNDVLAFTSDVPFPLFNYVSDARFASGDEARRTHEILDHFIARGLPFMWQVTPSGDYPGLGDVLVSRGLVGEAVPGMYAELRPPHTPALPVGVTVELVTTATFDTAIDVMAEAFEFPDFAVGPMRQLFRDLDRPTIVHALAHLDGVPVAAGSAMITGTTAGLYNIATLEAARGRGIGYAVTAALMDLGAELGCDHAILHATELGRPVYERLGFTEVCQTPRYVWVP